MISLKEQAVNMLQGLPDDKMTYVIDMLKWVTGILDEKDILFGKPSSIISSNSTDAVKAWKRLKSYKGIIPYDIDIKAELAEARDEKYANFN
jgi:hypothetical protein